MLRVAQLEIGRTRDSRARVDQVGRIEDAGAVLALVAARTFVAAVAAGPDNVAIRKETLVIDGVNLSRGSLFQEAILIQLMIEVLCDLVVLRRMGTAKVIEGKAEAVAEILLDGMHLGAILIDWKAGFVRG